MKQKVFTLFLILLLTPWLPGQALPEKPTAWCNDYAGVLTPQQRDSLNAILGAFEQRTSNQIFIAIFRRLPENTYLEDFAVRLFEKWRPGLPDKNNGILIVIFTEDRKARIEVGYGLEDVITDAQARRVLYDNMIPHFKKGDYYHGLLAGLKVLMPAAEGKYQIPLKRRSRKRSKSGDPVVAVFTIFLIFLFLYIFSRKGRHAGMTLGPGPVIVWHGGHPRRRRRREEDDEDDFWSGGSFGGGGGFSGGFGGLSGGGGASGSW